mgnify:FL=1
MNCLPTSKCTEREFDTTKYIVSNCNVIEVTLTQKQNTDCTTEFVSLLDASGNSYPENSEFVSVNNQISRVIIDGLSTCVADAMGGGSTIPTVQDCDGNDAVPVYDPCAMSKLDLIIEALNQAAMDNVKSVVQYQAQIESLANGQSAFYDYTMALDAAKAYTFSITGYAAYPLVQTTVSRQDSTTVRVVVENQSGDVIPATQIIITATSV